MPKAAPWPLLAVLRAPWKVVGAGPLHATALHRYLTASPESSTLLRFVRD
jgi:hypothetical protein